MKLDTVYRQLVSENMSGKRIKKAPYEKLNRMWHKLPLHLSVNCTSK